MEEGGINLDSSPEVLERMPESSRKFFYERMTQEELEAGSTDPEILVKMTLEDIQNQGEAARAAARQMAEEADIAWEQLGLGILYMMEVIAIYTRYHQTAIKVFGPASRPEYHKPVLPVSSDSLIRWKSCCCGVSVPQTGTVVSISSPIDVIEAPHDARLPESAIIGDLLIVIGLLGGDRANDTHWLVLSKNLSILQEIPEERHQFLRKHADDLETYLAHRHYPGQPLVYLPCYNLERRLSFVDFTPPPFIS